MPDRAVPDYRKLAEEAFEMAERAEDPNNRETLKHMAEVWLSLAADELTNRLSTVIIRMDDKQTAKRRICQKRQSSER